MPTTMSFIVDLLSDNHKTPDISLFSNLINNSVATDKHGNIIVDFITILLFDKLYRIGYLTHILISI